jgi:hypothetical protein
VVVVPAAATFIYLRRRRNTGRHDADAPAPT